MNRSSIQNEVKMGDRILYIRHKNAWFQFRDVEADGNCMYYCLAKCPATPLSSVDDIRQLLAKMMKSPSENLMNFFVEYHKSDDNPEPSLEKWQDTVMKEREWGSNFESSLFGAIYGVDIRIVTNTPTGLEESDTRTLLDMYQIDSETMIPKNAPTFYLYLHKHTLPQQPTKKPNHFAILDPVDHDPPEGSVIYTHPVANESSSLANSTASTKASAEADGNSTSSSSQKRKKQQSSSEQKGQTPAPNDVEGRVRRKETRERRTSIEMSALSNVLSEISTYDRSNANIGDAGKERRNQRRASMEDRKSWRNVMSEMSMMHQSEPNFDVAYTSESRRGDLTRRPASAREKRIRRKSEGPYNEKSHQERKLGENETQRRNGQHKTPNLSQRQNRSDLGLSRQRSHEEKRNDQAKDPRRSRRPTSIIEEEMIKPNGSQQEGSRKSRGISQRPDHSESNERASSAINGSRAQGSTRPKTPNDSSNRNETIPTRVHSPKVKDDGSVSSRGSKSGEARRQSLSISLQEDENSPARVSKSKPTSRSPVATTVRDEESYRSRTSQASVHSRVSRNKDDLDLQNHSRSNDRMRRRENEISYFSDVVEAPPEWQPLTARDEKSERLGRQRSVPITRSSRSPRRPAGQDQSRPSSQQDAIERSHLAETIRRKSLTISSSGPAKSPRPVRQDQPRSSSQQDVVERSHLTEAIRRESHTISSSGPAKSPRPVRQDQPRSSSQQDVFERSHLAETIRRKSLAITSSGPAKSPPRASRRSTMYTGSSTEYDNADLSVSKQQVGSQSRLQPLSSGRSSSPRSGRSGRRTSLPIQHDSHRYAHSFDDFEDATHDVLPIETRPEDHVRSKIESVRSQTRANTEDRQKRASRPNPRPRPARGYERSASSPVRSSRSPAEGPPNARSGSKYSSEKEMLMARAPLQGQSTSAWAAHFEGRTDSSRPEERHRPPGNHHMPSEDRQRMRRPRSTAS